MICRAARVRAARRSHSRLVGLGVRLKPGRSWFDSRGWDDGTPTAAWCRGAPQLRCRSRNRPLPPSRRVEVTSQCATLAPAGSTPVACSARTIWSARMRAGRTTLAHASPDANTSSSHSRGCGSCLGAARTGAGSCHPTRARARCALKARRASSDAYTSPIATALPGPSCPRAIGALFLVPGHVQPGARTHHARRVEDGCSSTCLSPDFARASCTTLLCEGAVRNCAGLRAGPFPRSDLW